MILGLYYPDLLEFAASGCAGTTFSISRQERRSSQLGDGAQRCSFEAVIPDWAVVLWLTRCDYDVFSLENQAPRRGLTERYRSSVNKSIFLFIANW